MNLNSLDLPRWLDCNNGIVLRATIFPLAYVHTSKSNHFILFYFYFIFLFFRFLFFILLFYIFLFLLPNHAKGDVELGLHTKHFCFIIFYYFLLIYLCSKSFSKLLLNISLPLPQIHHFRLLNK